MANQGNNIGDVSFAIQSVVESYGFSVVREFAGHGVGRTLHEEPEVPNFGYRKTGKHIEKDMVFAIEPMVNMGKPDIMIQKDGWTVVTRDGLPSAHFEETILITEKGNEILTVYGG